MKFTIMALLVRNVFLLCLNHPGNGIGTFLKYNFTLRSVESSFQWVTSGTLDILVSSLKINRLSFLFKELNPSSNDFLHAFPLSSRFCIVSVCLNV